MKRIFKILLLLAFAGQTTLVPGQTNPPKAPRSKMFDAVKLVDDLKTLSSDEMEGRSPSRPSIQRARDYVEKRFKEVGIEPIGSAFTQEFDIKRRSGAPLKGINFVGQIAGKKKDKFIVVSAHYDHVGVQKDQTYNGTDDNASGTAAMFAIASYFKKNRPQHSLVFVAFDAEELGLVGSRHFVANLPVSKASIVLNVNMDMVARGDNGELYASGAFHYPQFRKALESVRKTSSVKLLLGHDDPKLGRDDWTNQSDHASFHREKIPFIYFGVEDHADYHKPTDDFEKVDQDFYVRAVETIIAAVKHLDKVK